MLPSNKIKILSIATFIIMPMFFLQLTSVDAQVGSWTTVNPNPFDSSSNNIMLLTDGSVLVQGGNDWRTWYRLTPDTSGNYANGTWSQLASSLQGRLYYPSFILKDGRVWIAGGEYIQQPDANYNATEIFNPVTNTWTQGPDGLLGEIGDTGAAMLADGRLLVGTPKGPQTQIFDPITNTYTQVSSSLATTGVEANWQTLADGTVLDIITTAQRYLPTIDQWLATARPPVQLRGPAFELGPLVYLQNGTIFCIGEQYNTAFFTPPATPYESGSWTIGPNLPNYDSGGDTPAAIMPNGKVLVVGQSGIFDSVTDIYEFDPVNNSFVPTNASTFLNGAPGFTLRMVVLPNGQIMVYGQSSLHLYTPAGGPQNDWRPTINNITKNADGSYTLIGTQLNGRSWGASFGDDAMSSTNFPIVILKGYNGALFYARSFNFSTMGIWTGNTPVSCQFSLPSNIPGGTYRVIVSANGIMSNSLVTLTVNKTNKPRINCGGGAVGDFMADSGFSGGSTVATPHPIDSLWLNTPVPPQQVLQGERNGTNFSYRIGGFVPGSFHTVTCFFSENTFSARGQRVFNVTINGVPFLTNFDIINNTQVMFKAIQQNFGIAADRNGEYLLQFTGVVNNAKVDAIQIIY